MMTTEKHCQTLESLDPVQAIRAIHEAHAQLSAANRGLENLDNGPALESLRACLASAGHIGFTKGGGHV